MTSNLIYFFKTFLPFNNFFSLLLYGLEMKKSSAIYCDSAVQRAEHRNFCESRQNCKRIWARGGKKQDFYWKNCQVRRYLFRLPFLHKWATIKKILLLQKIFYSAICMDWNCYSSYVAAFLVELRSIYRWNLIEIRVMARIFRKPLI